VSDIVKEWTGDLIIKLESYLSGNIPHDEIREYAWDFAEESPKNPPAEDKPFWSTIFTIIHLADEEHWNDGCTQRDLESLLKTLKSGHSTETG